MSAAEVVKEWSLAFIRQADADFRAYELYEMYPDSLAAECHKLQFLQMACEKACNALVLTSGIHSSDDVQSSHGYIRKHLPTIIKQEMSFSVQNYKALMRPYKNICLLAGEIEKLNPSMDRDQRPENCEYPWASGNEVQSPLDWQFEATKLLMIASGRTFLKTFRLAINRLLNER